MLRLRKPGAPYGTETVLLMVARHFVKGQTLTLDLMLAGRALLDISVLITQHRC